MSASVSAYQEWIEEEEAACLAEERTKALAEQQAARLIAVAEAQAVLHYAGKRRAVPTRKGVRVA